MVHRLHGIQQSFRYQQQDLSEEDVKSFAKATECMSCRKVFDQEKCSKEMNMCPITNTYSGAMCKGCRYPRIVKCQTLPVIFHNFRGYDGHIILKHGIEKMKHWKLSVIAQTNEKFMTLPFPFDIIRF